MTTDGNGEPNRRALQACVMLSGGLDSSAALLWAVKKYERVLALSHDFSQPNRDAELYAAGKLCERLGVTWGRVVVPCLFPRVGYLAGVKAHDHEAAIDVAFAPGRNPVLIADAASWACAHFRTGSFDLVMGACADDRKFPDCKPHLLIQFVASLRPMYARQFEIVTPWTDRTKAQILDHFAGDADALDALARSWSCYSSDGPCRACTACVARDAAFAARGVADLAEQPVMTGGDPSRML